MRHTLFVTRAIVRLTGELLALAVPMAAMAQATRLLPLLLAAGTPGWDTAILLCGAMALLTNTLAPPVLAVAVAVTFARMNHHGAVRVLASHGVTKDTVAGTVRPVAFVSAVMVLGVGILGEPWIAGAMRHAGGRLAVHAAAGVLERNGQVEFLPGVVFAAPRGTRGGLYIANGTDAGVATVSARGYTLREKPHGRIEVALVGATGVSPEGVRATAGRVTIGLPAPRPPEDLVAEDLTDPFGSARVAPTRRHAARMLWGVLTWSASVWAAMLALSTRGSWARCVTQASVLPVVAMVLMARVGQWLAMAEETPRGVWGVTLALALTSVLATELTRHGVAWSRRRVL